ncbi:hypothetical protein [Streptomyces sp. NPDC052107]|uniref:hypothetical protein n=1 Tax=Streptomyces sp. NPDC052107 TaxID=3155632 RepID=UPI003417D7C7
MCDIDVSNDSALDSGDRAWAGRSALEARLAELTETLGTHGLSVVRRNVYYDESGDGTGDLLWLWLCAAPRRFPEETHDLVVRYSTADGDWQVSAPDGRTRRIPAAAGAAPPAAAIADVLSAAQGGAPPEPPALRDMPDWVSLVLSGAATSLIIPFVQAVAGKSADDVYAGLRARLARRGRPAPDPSASDSAGSDTGTPDPHVPHDASGFVSIRDPEADLQLVMPDPVPPDAVRQLMTMDRSELRGRTLVWDDSRQEWFRCRRT